MSEKLPPNTFPPGAWPYPAPAPAAVSGAAAVIAGVLALLIALFRAFKTYVYLLTAQAFSHVPSGYPNHAGGAEAFSVIAAIVSGVGTVALFVGALMLFNRNPAGRRWIALGCLIAIADVVVTWLSVYVFFHAFADFMSSPLRDSGGPSGADIVSGVLSREAPSIALSIALSAGVPLLTMILALSASARRWCEAKGPAHPVETRPGWVPPAQATGWAGPSFGGQSHADYERQAAQHFGAGSHGAPVGPGIHPPARPWAPPTVPASYTSYSPGGSQESFVTRLMERGMRGELFRQPWFDDIRTRLRDPFVVGAYAVGALVTILLALTPSMFFSTVLGDALWVAIGYLYLAVGSKLAHQFLLFGVCLVGTLVMVVRIVSTISNLSMNQSVARLYGSYMDPTALLLLDLLLNVAGAALLVYVGLQLHRGIQRFTTP